MTAASAQSRLQHGVPVVRSVSRSHLGLVRAINEDRVFDRADARIWAVADGMGGHRGGDLAAQTVVDRLRDLAARGHEITLDDMLGALTDANAAIHARNADLGLDAGATVVAAVAQGAVVHIAWSGDSRAYRVRDDRAALLTHDHSLVQELIDAGLLSTDAAERHPQANVVTRALGVDAAANIDVVTVDLLAGDRLILCSDGLSRSLHDDDLTRTVAIDALADMLLANALTRDGNDNVSLVVVEAAGS